MSVPRVDARGPMAFEQILASLHGLLGGARFRAGGETVSFEIAKIKRKIYFYVAVPRHLRTLISSQFYAQYPEVQIEEVSDYFTKSLVKDKKVLVAELEPDSPSIFPIKRHPQFENNTARLFEDPIGPITAAISHLYGRDDNAVLQITVTPISPKWNKAARENAKDFFRGGLWSSTKWQSWYYRARLPHSRLRRRAQCVLWGPMMMMAGLGKAPSLTQSGPSDDEVDNLEREERTSGRHDRESAYGAVYDKLSRLHFGVNIRAVYIHSDPDPLHAEAKIREVLGTFKQFSLPGANAFQMRSLTKSEHGAFDDVLHRRVRRPFAMSQEELATIFHLPTETVRTPGIQWIDCPKLEPPVDLPTEDEEGVTLIGETNFRTQKHRYGIRTVDRRRHVYIIGKTGMGKSTIMENMIASDIQKGRGVAVIDPHGDLAEAVLQFIPKHRTNDVILFDPADRDFPVAFNMLEGKNAEQRGLVASGLVGVIKKLNIDSWGPRLEHFLRNTILALVEAPDTTMLGITRMLVDPIYQAKILHYVTDPMVRAFWETEYRKLEPRQRTEACGPIQNKVGQFLSTPTIRNIVGQPKSTLDIRFAMDTGKIVIVNLSKGKIGEDNSAMLGSLLITKFQIDAMSRADQKAEDRKDFYLYVDEFQNFATDSFATILSEARKYKLNLTMANQYVAQMSDEVAAAVFGNVGSLISFQVGIDDAQVFSTQFDEERISPIALASLPKYQIYNRIMLDGLTTPVFSANTLPPPPPATEEDPDARLAKIKAFSRQRYAKPREVVERKILRWSLDENAKRKSKKKTENTEKSSNKKEQKPQQTKGNTPKKPPTKKES